MANFYIPRTSSRQIMEMDTLKVMKIEKQISPESGSIQPYLGKVQ